MLSVSGCRSKPVDVWLDVDTTNGLVDTRPRDVDDGLAILLALHSPELKVRGVSVCFGNGSLDQTLPIAREILARFGPRDLRATPGAASAQDLSKETDATLVLQAEMNRRRLTILALGPVTNVASVVQNHPELRERIRRIIVVAGRRPGFGFHPPARPDVIFPDANFEKDVEGMRVLLSSGIPIVFAGYEVSSDVWLTRRNLIKLASRSDCGKWIAQTSEAWLRRWEDVHKLKGFNPFDTLAVGRAIDPALMESVPVTAEIQVGPDDRAAGQTKPYLICTPTSAPSNLTYCTVARPKFRQILLQRLCPGREPSR